MRQKIVNIMSKVFEFQDSSHSLLVKDHIASWDSIGHMNLVVALEEEFNVVFTDEEIGELLSLDLIELIIEEKLNDNTSR